MKGLRRRGAPQGFTIVELMITVAIIGILVAVAVAGIYNYRTERVGLEASRQVAERLRGLHRMAVTSNRAVVLRITEGAAGQLSADGERGRIDVLVSSDNTCANATVVNQNISLNFKYDATNPTRFSERFRFENVQIVSVSPQPESENASLELCIKPDGRVVNALTLQPLTADSFSTGRCSDDAFAASGDAMKDIAIAATNWEAQCDRAGVVCLRLSNLNDTCPARCPSTGECDSRYGIDNIVVMTYTGQTRLVR